MGLFSRSKKDGFEDWVQKASHSELADAYEQERLQWIKDGYNSGTGRRTKKMERLNAEINKRVEDEWENNPHRNRDPNYRWTDANRWEKD